MWYADSMVFVYKNLAQFAVRCALPPRRSESPVCATVNKPSCMLHLLGWFIGSRGFSSLERRPKFWVLQNELPSVFNSNSKIHLSMKSQRQLCNSSHCSYVHKPWNTFKYTYIYIYIYINLEGKITTYLRWQEFLVNNFSFLPHEIIL